MNSPLKTIPSSRRPLLVLLGCLLTPLAVAAAQPGQTDMHHTHMDHTAPPVPPRPVALGQLTISSVWARATVPSVAVGAAYFTINNRGLQPDTLIGASCPAAAKAMFHRTTEENGVSHMAPAGDIQIPAGKTVKIEPGGLHLMLMGLKQPLRAGMMVPLTLRFRNAGEVLVQMEVVPIGASAMIKGAGQDGMPHDRTEH